MTQQIAAGVEQQIAGSTEPAVGIALSGGGVRAAAFGLGALQALQEARGLVYGPDHARYLAAVSGGSYTAAAVLMARAGPMTPGETATEPEEADPADGGRRWVSVPSPDPLRRGSTESDYLRVHARYLLEAAPAATVLQFAGLMVVSLLTTLSIAAVSGLVSRTLWDLVDGSWLYRSALILALVLGSAAAFWYARVAAGHRVRTAGAATDREISMYDAVVLGIALLCAGAVGAWYLENAEAVTQIVDASRGRFAAGALAVGLGGSSLLGPALIALVRAQMAPRRDTRSRRSRLVALSQRAAIAVAETALLVLVPLTLLAAFLLGWIGVRVPVPGLDHRSIGWLAAVVLLAVLVVAIVVGDQALSPHALYRNRLARAFSMIRQQDQDQPPDVDPATQGGASLWPVRTRARRTQPAMSALLPRPPFTWQNPELLICASVNITESGVAAAGSHARPIIFSPTTITVAGEPFFQMDTGAYERTIDQPRRAFRHSFDATVMSYVALTGAAVSPTMGKYTKYWLRAVLTLANIRLGVWIPNPASPQVARKAAQGQTVHFNHCPGPLLWLRELRGRHYVRAKQIHVSDGGHYENLGIVELIRRGCREVWAIDASGDDRGTWRALAESLNLIASELGCEIVGDFSAFEAYDRVADDQRLINRTYTDVRVRGKQDGADFEAVIHVVKLGMSRFTNDVIAHLGTKYRKFPYDSTLNQLYTAERFDLYRALGHDSAAQAIAAAGGAQVT